MHPGMHHETVLGKLGPGAQPSTFGADSWDLDNWAQFPYITYITSTFYNHDMTRRSC